MLSEDDQGDPKVGTLVAQKLVDAKVAAVIGHLNSGVTIPASEIYSRAGIPVISGSATNPALTERGLKGVFRTVGRDDQQGPAIAAYIAGELNAQAGGDRRRQDRVRRGPRDRGGAARCAGPASPSSGASAPPTRKPTSRRSSRASRTRTPTSSSTAAWTPPAG